MMRQLISAIFPAQNGLDPFQMGLAMPEPNQILVTEGPDLNQPIEVVPFKDQKQSIRYFAEKVNHRINTFMVNPKFEHRAPLQNQLYAYDEELLIGVRLAATSENDSTEIKIGYRWHNDKPLDPKTDNPYYIYELRYAVAPGGFRFLKYNEYYFNDLNAECSVYQEIIAEYFQFLLQLKTPLTEALETQPYHCRTCGDDRVRLINNFIVGVYCNHLNKL